jgi:murein DD-endopeptidase MepM/ murein hydrolase activator NlpD
LSNTATFRLPLTSPKQILTFDRCPQVYHPGIDYDGDEGDPVLVAADGLVVTAFAPSATPSWMAPAT